MLCPECGEITAPGPLDPRRLVHRRRPILHRWVESLRLRCVGNLPEKVDG